MLLFPIASHTIKVRTKFSFFFTVNPPSPVPFPIAGRYNFEQKAVRENEKYATRIRGVTQRPRIQVDCRIVVSEMKSCANEMNKISIDAEYCETVDYRGRPIGEYGMLYCIEIWQLLSGESFFLINCMYSKNYGGGGVPSDSLM